MPIQDKMCDSLESVPENGYVDPGGELVARVDDRKKMARCLTLEKQLVAARKQIQDLECGLDPDSRQVGRLAIRPRCIPGKKLK